MLKLYFSQIVIAGAGQAQMSIEEVKSFEFWILFCPTIYSSYTEL